MGPERGKIRVETSERSNVIFQTLASILIRCFFLGLALTLFWFLLYLAAPEWIFEMNAKWFAIQKQDFALVNYYGIAFLKICNILFFLFPYLAIKWTFRRKK
jgi:hypothetical protein